MNNIYGQSFGEYIKEKRKQTGYTYKVLSEKMGIGIGYLGDIESGRALAPKRYLDKLIEIFNIQGEELEKFYYLASVSRSDLYDIYAKKVLEDPLLREIVKKIDNSSLEEAVELVRKYKNK